jgi:peptide deformylase
MFRKVLEWPNSELKKKSTPLTQEDPTAWVDDLRDSFNVSGGLGLAAPQIGIHKRVIVVNPNFLDIADEEMLVMINPTLTLSGEMQKMTEACFSVPFVTDLVPRYSHCKVVFYNEEWKEQWLNLTGLAAVCIQHEVDHLDGVLYLDRIGRLKRSILIKKMKKQAKKLAEIKQGTLEDFERDHAELQAVTGGKEKVKTTYSRKRKAPPRKKNKKQRKRK